MSKKMDKTYSGFIAIVGRPNVGKSTILNQVLGRKISITSRKPQTTRHRILGIKTEKAIQMVYVDTPGIHTQELKAMNRYMNKVAKRSLQDVDVILFVIEALKWTFEDEQVLKLLRTREIPVILVVNKVDLVDKKELLPFLKDIATKMDFSKIFPLSAKKKADVKKMEHLLLEYIPKAPHYFSADQITDRSQRFLVAEIIREKLMRQFSAELPYASTIEIEKFQEEERLYRISAIIWLEREGQKAIVIGKQGERLKKIGSLARIAIEQLVGKKVFLELWAKVKRGWADDERALQSLGYFDAED